MKRKWTTLAVSSILAVSTVMGGGISAMAASKSSTGGTTAGKLFGLFLRLEDWRCVRPALNL
ncbi:hypothetical protein M5X11_14710 [Paenibacillus alginolyticus]|uniref:hypothetical protein n=1 Tax=Paenibacillus alginolyticus TaxID=59839 RepID=UPI0003F7D7BD|nr:hypothetical protein [Paenibacillus alginolyticus]MCY9666203.1 hypothetical protein [Paenibacillus alginolyticus]